MVLRGFERDYRLEENEAAIYILDLLNHRDISAKIAERFQVFHESPQFIVLKNGVTVSSASHQDINVLQLK